MTEPVIPTWKQMAIVFGITCAASIALGVTAAALLGDPWGGRGSLVASLVGGFALARMITQRQAAKRAAAARRGPGGP